MPVRAYVFALFLLWPVVLVDVNGPPMVDPVLLAAIRLVERGTFTISDADPRMVSQLEAFDISVYDGRVYSGVGPGASVIAAPFYALLRPLFAQVPPDVIRGRASYFYARRARQLGLQPSPHLRDRYLLQIALVWLVIAPLSAWLAARLFGWLERRGLGRGHALAICLALGLGSLLLYYGSMYSRQMLAGLLLWHAMLTLEEARARTPAALLAAGAACGMAIAVDYPAVLVAAPVLACLLPRCTWPQRLRVLAPCALVLAGLALYHALLFGSPLSTPYHHRYWFTTAQQIKQGLDPATFERGRYVGMNLPSPGVMAALLLGRYKGLFAYCPILLLGLGGLLQALRAPRSLSRREALFCLAVFALLLAFNSTMGTHLPPERASFIWGGLSFLWGPRHLLGAIPFLALGLAAWRWERSLPRGLIVAALLASFAINFAASSTKQITISMVATDKRFAAPIRLVLELLARDGPRVTLLDSYRVAPALQVMVLLLLLGASVALALRIVRARS